MGIGIKTISAGIFFTIATYFITLGQGQMGVNDMLAAGYISLGLVCAVIGIYVTASAGGEIGVAKIKQASVPK